MLPDQSGFLSHSPPALGGAYPGQRTRRGQRISVHSGHTRGTSQRRVGVLHSYGCTRAALRPVSPVGGSS